jgi:hypothetical protein
VDGQPVADRSIIVTAAELRASGTGSGPLILGASWYVTSHEGCVGNRIRFSTEKEPSCSRYYDHLAQELPAVKGAKGRSRWAGGGLRAAAEGLAVGMPLVPGSDPSSPPKVVPESSRCGQRTEATSPPGAGIGCNLLPR